MRGALFIAVVLGLVASAFGGLVTGRCLEDGHTLCPSVNGAPDFCCAPEDVCWRPTRNVSGVIVYGQGGCIPRGGVGCDDGHTCAADQVCCGTKCMPQGSNCCGNGIAFCPNGVPCGENPLKCTGVMAAISPLLIFALLLTYLLL